MKLLVRIAETFGAPPARLAARSGSLVRLLTAGRIGEKHSLPSVNGVRF